MSLVTGKSFLAVFHVRIDQF